MKGAAGNYQKGLDRAEDIVAIWEKLPEEHREITSFFLGYSREEWLVASALLQTRASMRRPTTKYALVSDELVAELKRGSQPVTIRLKQRPRGELHFIATRHECPGDEQLGRELERAYIEGFMTRGSVLDDDERTAGYRGHEKEWADAEGRAIGWAEKRLAARAEASPKPKPVAQQNGNAETETAPRSAPSES